MTVAYEDLSHRSSGVNAKNLLKRLGHTYPDLAAGNPPTDLLGYSNAHLVYYPSSLQLPMIIVPSCQRTTAHMAFGV